MSDHHHHDHHGHHHDHDDPFHARPDEPLNLDELDPASRSLAEALRISFMALKGIMILLVVYFAFSGAFEIQEGQVGVRLHLGAASYETYEPGIHLSWPEPIDRIIRVSTLQRQVPIERAFWMNIPEGAEAQSLDELQPQQNLTPGVDGSLVTGDKNIVHARWEVNYQVRSEDAVLFVANVTAASDRVAQREAADAFVRHAAERAIVHAVAQVSADDFVRANVNRDQIRFLIQEQLDAFESGITVNEVLLQDPTPPLAVREAFQRVSGAETDKAQMIDNARRDASRILNQVAGGMHEELVAAIDAYDLARHGDDQEAIEAADERVTELLERSTGEVSGMIQDAHTYRRELVSRVQAEANLFEQLLPVYNENPNIVLSRLWQDTRQSILAGDVETFYLPSEENKHIYLELNRDPRVQQQRERARFRAEQEQNQPGGR
ncbi:MAG: SPFH domain-containing protein [Phycisphaeraceae bacterium]